MFFNKRASVDGDEQDLLLAAWRWLDEVLDPVAPDYVLWLPGRVHFPASAESGHAAALHDFTLVKRHCAMATWPARLVAQRQRPRLVATWAHDYVSTRDPSGTYSSDGTTAIITYDPDLLQHRPQLIYTLAHELAHYALSTAPTPPPGGDEFQELYTDLAAAHMGFGLFGCSTVIKSYQGALAYMPEHVWYFVTALFC